MRRTVAAGVACAVVALAAAGCSGGDQDMPGLTASPTQTATPAETPTPTPSETPTSIAGTVVDLSDPELGIVFEDVPELSGDEADVHNWIATFEVEYWRTLTTNAVSPGFAVFASPEEQAKIAGFAEQNTTAGLEIGGTYHVSIDDIVVNGDTATGLACDDYTDVTLARPDGPRSLADEGIDVPRLIEFTLARSDRGDGLWTVVMSDGVGSC